MFDEQATAALKLCGDELLDMKIAARIKLFEGLSHAFTKVQPAGSFEKLPHREPDQKLVGWWQQKRSVDGTILEPIAKALTIMGIRCEPTIGSVIRVLDLSYDEYRAHFMTAEHGPPIKTSLEYLRRICESIVRWRDADRQLLQHSRLILRGVRA